MALPKEHRTPEVEELERIVGNGTELSLLGDLLDDDVRLIGSYIQVFNFIELNLRRCIEMLAVTQRLPSDIASRRHDLRVPEVIDQLKAAFRQVALDENDANTSSANFDEIEFRRPMRNLLAHWAAKRIPGHDALVFITRNGRDHTNLRGEELPPDSVGTAIVRLPDLRGLTAHVLDLQHWLADKTVELGRKIGAFN